MVEQICPICNKSYKAENGYCEHCGFIGRSSDILIPSGTVLNNRYKVQKLVYAGGMSYVYLAQDKNLFERSCVIKQVKERIHSREHRAKLEEEALRMARLTHPSIAIILDHFVERDHYFLVEEQVRGKTLSEVFKERQDRLKEEEVIRWGISICDVLNYIHGEGILHRDISPDNIMLTEEGTIKFIDFGTLRELRTIEMGKTAGMGKYGYTPPEQWKGEPLPQSDIFALGATLYYLLTGFLPLSRSYLTGQVPQREDIFPKFPPIRQRNPQISSSLESVLQKALQLHFYERYRNALEMRQDLENLKQEIASRGQVSPVTTIISNGAIKNERLPAKPSQEASGKIPPRESSKTGGKIRKRVKRTPVKELSEATIKRHTISVTIQHPATMLPMAICILGAFYLIILSPIFGGTLGAGILIGISAATAGGTYVARYQKEHLRVTRELMNRLEAERLQAQDEELQELRDTLESGFLSIDCTEGNRTLEGLISEYEELQPALSQQRSTDSLSVSLIPALAGETYRRGLGVLSDALDLRNIIHTPGREKLEKEIAELEKEVEALKGDENQAARLSLKQEMLASVKERVEQSNKLQLHFDQLLYQAQRCEAALHSTRIELATARAGGTKSTVDSVIETLRERINQVKEVQEELTRMGY